MSIAYTNGTTDAQGTVAMDEALWPDTTRRQTFRTQLAEMGQKTLDKIPSLNGRVAKAMRLVLAGDVVVRGPLEADVQSCSTPDLLYQIREGLCPCKDAPQAPEGLCCHRLAAGFLRKLQETRPPLLDADGWPPEEEPPPHPTIPRKYLKSIGGKDFVLYAGLLTMAHAVGLTKLEARFISVAKELAVAEATATFADGRVFTEAGDSTPENVQFKAHFARVALTRAKARTLRDALCIAECSAEEVEGGQA